MRRRTEKAWRLRWGSLLSCAAARAVATSLLELPAARGADGETPAAADVEQDSRYAGLTVSQVGRGVCDSAGIRCTDCSSLMFVRLKKKEKAADDSEWGKRANLPVWKET